MVVGRELALSQRAGPSRRPASLAGGDWPSRCDLHCDVRSSPMLTVCNNRSRSTVNLWHFQLLLYCKCTQGTVITKITRGRQGPTLDVNSSLVVSEREERVGWKGESC